MKLRRMPRRAERMLNLDDIPGTREKIAAGTDITSELLELIDSAQAFSYPAIKLTTLYYRPARVTVNVNAGGITTVTIHDGGRFQRTPTVSLSGGGGTGGVLTPVMTGDPLNGYTITSLTVTNPGSGYATSPTASFSVTNRLLFNGQLLIPINLDVHRDEDAYLRYTGSANEDHVRIGDVYRSNSAWIDIAIERATFSTWNAATENNDTGINWISPYYAKGRFHADGFTNNLKVYSEYAAAAYTDVDLLLLRSGQNDLLLHKGPNNAAWMNQIRWNGSGGSFNTDTGALARTGYTAGVKYPIAIKFWGENNFNEFNNHTFQDCCFEISGGYAESVCCEFDGSASNIKFAGNNRHENANVEFFRHKSGIVTAVDLELGYTTSGLWDIADMWNSVAGADFFSTVKIRDPRRHGSQPAPVWNSPNFGQTAIQYDSAGRIYVPGMFWQNPSDNTKRKSSVGTANTITADAVEIVATDAIGMHVLLGKCRMLCFIPMVKSGSANLRQQWIGYNAGRTIRYSPAYATTTQSGGVIQTPTVFQGGYFSVAPTITVTGSGGGSGAVLTPVLSGGTSGTLSSITVTNGGSGYSGTITITITPNEKDWIQGYDFQRPMSTFYGCYMDNVGADTPFPIWVRSDVKEVSWHGRASGGPVELSGMSVVSLDGHPFTVVSWHGGAYSDFTRKFINYAPSGTIKGNHVVGEVIWNDAATVAGDAWGYRVRSGPAYDSCVP